MNDALLEAMVSNTVIAALLGVAGWLFAGRLRRPALGHTLFVLALIKLVTPPLVPVTVWSDSRAARIGRVVHLERLPTTPERVPTAMATPDSFEPTSPIAAPVQPAGGANAPIVAASLSTPISTATAIGWTWLLGSLLVGLLLTCRIAALVRMVRKAQPADDELLVEVREAARRIGLRRLPQVRCWSGDVPPLVVGIPRRTFLLVPGQLRSRIDRDARLALWMHELAHLRRGDHLVRWLESAVRCALWWHPLCWWLIRQLREAEESACDGWATAASSPAQRRGYCDALLLVASGCALPSSVPASPAARLAGGRLRAWQRRLEEVMNRGPVVRFPRAGQLVVALLGIALMPLALCQEPAPAKESLAGRIETAQIAFQLEDAPLSDWAAFLARLLEVDVVIEPSVQDLEPDRTRLHQLRLPKTSVRRVLDVIALLTDLTWRIEGDRAIHFAVRSQAPAATSPTILVHCFGAFGKKGPVRIDPETATLIDLLHQQTWTEQADLSAVQLVRPDGSVPLRIDVDVREMLTTGDTSSNLALRDGDIVTVPERIPEDLPPLTLRPGVGVRFVVEPTLLVVPGCELLSELIERQRVQRDGTIFVPYVGPVKVDGKTRDELTELVRQELAKVLTVDALVWARLD